MSLNLDEFLSLERGAGTYQSEGEFTLSTRQSLEKLAAYQLKEPGLWLVKLVQCAVASGASHFQVNVRKDGLLVSFDADPGLTARELWEAILDPSRSLEAGMQHLVVGMRALYGQHDQLAWVCAGPTQASMVALHGDSLEERTTENSPRLGFQLVVNREITPGERVSGWLGRSLIELETVGRYCWLAPIKITLEGREVQHRPDSLARLVASWEVRGTAETAGSMMVRRAKTKAKVVAQDGGDTLWEPLPKKGKPYLERRIDEHGGGAFVESLVTLESGTESRLHYVYHGALVEGPTLQIALSKGFAVQVYAPVNELNVDLSEFATSHRDPKILKAAYPQAVLMLERFLDCLEGRIGHEGNDDPHLAGAGASLATIATFVKTKAIFMGLVGLPVSLAVGGGVVTAKKMSSHHRKMEKLDLTNVLKGAIRQLERQAWVGDMGDVTATLRYRPGSGQRKS